MLVSQHISGYKWLFEFMNIEGGRKLRGGGLACFFLPLICSVRICWERSWNVANTFLQATQDMSCSSMSVSLLWLVFVGLCADCTWVVHSASVLKVRLHCLQPKRALLHTWPSLLFSPQETHLLMESSQRWRLSSLCLSNLQHITNHLNTTLTATG